MQKFKFETEKEWLAFRKNHLGASDASIIMGASKWKLPDGRIKTPYLLWNEKLGFEDLSVDTEATRYGKQMEEPARIVYQEMKKEEFKPVVVKNKKFPYLIASLDGINKTDTQAVEIKNCSEKDHKQAKEGKIPEKYIAQVQQQILVTELNEIDYFSFHNGEGIIVPVKRDEKYLKQLKKKLKEFWEYVENLKEPPLTENDYIKQNLQWEIYARELYLIKKEKYKLSTKEKELEEKLKFMCGDKSGYFGPYRYQRTVSTGRINYKSIPEFKNIDLDKYRSEPIISWRLIKGKDNKEDMEIK